MASLLQIQAGVGQFQPRSCRHLTFQVAGGRQLLRNTAARVSNFASFQGSKRVARTTSTRISATRTSISHAGTFSSSSRSNTIRSSTLTTFPRPTTAGGIESSISDVNDVVYQRLSSSIQPSCTPSSIPPSSSTASGNDTLAVALSVLQSLQTTQKLMQARQAPGDPKYLAVLLQLQAAVDMQQQLVSMLEPEAAASASAQAAPPAAYADRPEAAATAVGGSKGSNPTCTQAAGSAISCAASSDAERLVPEEQALLPLSRKCSSSSSSNSSRNTATPGASSARHPAPVVEARESRKVDHYSSLSHSSWGSSNSSDSSKQAHAVTTVYVASAAAKGLKKAMEDYHCVASIDPSDGVKECRGGGVITLDDSHSCAFGAVFDGHGGHQTAAYTAGNFAPLLHSELNGHRNPRTSCSSGVGARSHAGRGEQSSAAPASPRSPKHALTNAFLRHDKRWGETSEFDRSGSTAVVALVNKQRLVVANAGDSVAVLARGSTAHRLSATHRPDDPAEAARVKGAGGLVGVMPGKRDGVLRVMRDPSKLPLGERYATQPALAVTRSFGDFKLKSPQVLTAEPHVAEVSLIPGDSLVLLTSDGVTDVLSDDSMMEVAFEALKQARVHTRDGQELARAAAAAVKSVALESGAWDNLTVVAMLLDWQHEWISE